MTVAGTRRDLVRTLRDVRATDVRLAGGKGANLGELVSAGFPVPEGFVLGTDAYVLAAAHAGVDPHDPKSAHDRILAARIPDELTGAVVDAYRAMGAPRVAVRSSATAEDLPEASFAGQQDTILGVGGEDALLDAVRRCWASLWNERAVAYRRTHGVDEASLGLAVVVQRMVEASAAGVLFTADPITGRRRHAAIDAVRGLGEQLVSGAVNPEHYAVDTRTGAVVERRGEILDDRRLRELAALGAKVEDHFGRPQDIEWAIDPDGKLWLVQSRDITTLYPLPPGLPDPDTDLRVLFSANVAQGVLEPFTPIGLETFRLMASVLSRALGADADPATRKPLTVVAGMRIFIDLTDLIRNPALRDIAVRALSVMEARSAPVVARLAEDPRLGPRTGTRRTSRLGLLRMVLRTGVPWLVASALLRPDATRKRLLAEVDALVHSDLGPHGSALEGIGAFERLFLTVPPRLFPKLVALAAAGYLSFGIAGRILGRSATQDELRAVLRGLPFNPTTEMDLALWELARRAGADQASRAALTDLAPEQLSAAYLRGLLPPILQRELSAFLDRYGHRAIAEIDLGVPRWSEDPTHLLGAIANYQRLTDQSLAPDAQFARGAREAEAMVERLAARERGPKRAVVRALLRRVRLLSGTREVPKFNIIRVFARGRAILAPVGAELASAGRIATAEDLWFLTVPEMRDALAGTDQRDLVERRRAEYVRERARHHIPRILLSDGTDAEAAYAPPAAAGAIRGTAASPGIAHGTAHVIMSPAGARLEPGEVLVAPSTDPGWTPLFLTASALVMEMGGMMSHGAVVAREYGIPAVVGVPDATSRIKSGSAVTVDGSAGTVAVDL